MSAVSAIPIESLPLELTSADTIEAAYRDELDRVVEKLGQGISVIIECDKQLVVHLFRALRQRVKDSGVGGRSRLRLVSGHSAPQEAGPAQPMQTIMQRILRELQEAVFSGATDEIIALTHLDTLTTTTRSGLGAETREAAALLYENPDAVFLGFKDPSFEIPKVIDGVFPLRVPLIGIHRERLPSLVCQSEARKLGELTFDPYSLYKYVSGLNAIRLRQVLAQFRTRVDFSSTNPGSRDTIIREIREMTISSDIELPAVDLEKDIGGYAKVKDQIQKEILDLLAAKDQTTDPADVLRLEELIPKGMIFHGPPGTGKTFFAKAIATSMDAVLTVVSGPELKSKWVGESEENLRAVFAKARKSAPALIVFDELDSFAAARGSYAGSGVEHSMVNQLLTEMDGFRKEEMVFIIGTTNFVESLDSALMRPGRFELCIHIPAPRDDDRKAILEIYRDRFNLNVPDDVLDYAVRKTSGFADDRQTMRYTGDHLYALARALKREELRRGGDGPMEITNNDVDAALAGPGKSGERKLQEQEQQTIAVHESGHAVLAYVLPHCPTIEKVTISTGDGDEALGYVMQKVKKNRYVTTEDELLDDVCVLLAGREAERLLLEKVSVGAYSDLQRANEIARMMVEELGMSDVLGARTVGSGGDSHGGMVGAARRSVSEETAREVDEAISQILNTQQERAKATLAAHRDHLIGMRNALLDKKTLRLKDIRELFDGKEYKADPEPEKEPEDDKTSESSKSDA